MTLVQIRHHVIPVHVVHVVPVIPPNARENRGVFLLDGGPTHVYHVPYVYPPPQHWRLARQRFHKPPHACTSWQDSKLSACLAATWPWPRGRDERAASGG